MIVRPPCRRTVGPARTRAAAAPVARSSLALLAAALVPPTPAHADITLYSDRGEFEADAEVQSIDLSLESFEELPLSPNSADFASVSLPGFELSAVNEGFEFLPPLAVQGPTGAGGTFASQGLKHINVGSLYSPALNNDVVVTFDFAEPVAALFLDITDLRGLDQAPNPRAFLETDGGDVVTLLDGQNPNQGLLTVGFITDTPFTAMTLRSTAGDSFGIDAVSFGIPTPGAAALLGVAGLAANRRRRASASPRDRSKSPCSSDHVPPA